MKTFCALGLTILIGACGVATKSPIPTPPVPANPDGNQAAAPTNVEEARQIADEVITLMGRHFYEPIDLERWIVQTLDRGLSELDEHSSLMLASDQGDPPEKLPGYFGIEYKRVGEDIVVGGIEHESPAWRANITIGDKIVSINGEATQRMLYDEVQVTFDTSKTCTLKIRRGSEHHFVTLARALFPSRPELEGLSIGNDLGYIYLANFRYGHSENMRRTMQAMRSKSGLILDLRSNPGGQKAVADELVSYFVPVNSIIGYEGPSHKDARPTRSKDMGILLGMPIIVLVNRSSASGSESVAQTLRDLGRAIVVGEQTFGLGTVFLEWFVLGRKYDLAVPYKRYFGPSWGSINRTGVTPDIAVTETNRAHRLLPNATGEYDAILETGRRVLEEHLGSYRVQPAGYSPK